ncbi:lipopolysaccharide biosynthesis protein [Neptunomonas qingdaonensis]|uniref:Membrane protein involved in the export of O-antigen and teichoic acid n=1 Tax=Neptunomonas qingdaonensis TaxID=1045558 RepID=A0A1I2VSP4_9GAMM|nr:oligosaccharide flippase family protein [Neptunomonas qingdaonensis]SFG92258.1 Membrane protein involved in the export of O-antigen and teichoic acid [Neptunomonas qingdaonensis]
MNIRTISSFAIGPIGAAALGFITLPIVTWFYSTEDVGRIAMLYVMSNFCVMLFSLGLDQAYVREYHITMGKGKSALLKATLLPGLILLAVALIICLVKPGFISKALFAVDSVLISLLVAICFLATFISRFLSLILRMQEKGLAYSMSQILPKILFVLVIGTYVLFSFGFDLFHLVIAHTISILVVTLIYAWNTRIEWLAACKSQVDIQNLKVMIRFGAPLVLGGAAFWGLTAIDKLFLRSYSSFEQLGIYSVSVSFAAAASIFQSVFSTVWAPIVYKWAHSGEGLDKVEKVTQYVLLCVLLLFCFVGAFSWIVDFILPESYSSVKYIVVSCLGYPLLYTMSETTVIGIHISRKTFYSMVACIVAFAFNVLGNMLLIPHFGAAGAAVSTSMAFLLFLLLRTEFSVKLWRPIPRRKIYLFTFLMVVIALITTLYGEQIGYILHLIWFGLLLIVLLSFKKEVVETIGWCRALSGGENRTVLSDIKQ